jgi:hypothetical protein
MAAYFVQTCYACVWYTVQNVWYTVQNVWYTRITGLNKIYRHSTENVYKDKYTGTRDVILAERGLWLRDDGLCKPKLVGAAFIILIVLII